MKKVFFVIDIRLSSCITGILPNPIYIVRSDQVVAESPTLSSNVNQEKENKTEPRSPVFKRPFLKVKDIF